MKGEEPWAPTLRRIPPEVESGYYAWTPTESSQRNLNARRKTKKGGGTGYTLRGREGAKVLVSWWEKKKKKKKKNTIPPRQDQLRKGKKGRKDLCYRSPFGDKKTSSLPFSNRVRNSDGRRGKKKWQSSGDCTSTKNLSLLCPRPISGKKVNTTHHPHPNPTTCRQKPGAVKEKIAVSQNAHRTSSRGLSKKEKRW